MVKLTKVSGFVLASSVIGMMGVAGPVSASSVYSSAGAFQASYGDVNTLTSISGPFQFGFYTDPTASLVAFDKKTSDAGLEFWQSSTVQEFGVPTVFYNKTDASITDGTLTLGAGQLAFHPGVNTDTVIRFVAPSAGSYKFSTAMQMADSGSTRVFVLEQGVAGELGQYLFDSGYDNNTLQTFTYDNTIYLNSGQYVDFAVNNNGSVFNDSTALIKDLTVTPVPLPSSAGVGFGLLGGLGAVAAFRRHLRGKRRIA